MKNVRLLLLVDDAGEFRSHCKTALENKGFDVELCRKDGRELLEKIRERHPALTLC